MKSLVPTTCPGIKRELPALLPLITFGRWAPCAGERLDGAIVRLATVTIERNRARTGMARSYARAVPPPRISATAN
jgi:hypothetical protein